MRGRAARLAAIAFASVTVALACGTRPSSPTRPPPVAGTDGGARARIADVRDAASPSEGLPSFDELATAARDETTLMVELLRTTDMLAVPDASQGGADVTLERDACVRAAFASNVPTRVAFYDARGALRGPETTGTSGLVPPLGPACGRRGDRLRLVATVEGRDAQGAETSGVPTARAVIWITTP